MPCLLHSHCTEHQSLYKDTRVQAVRAQLLSSKGNARYSLNIVHWLGCRLLGFRSSQGAAAAAPEGRQKCRVCQPVLSCHTANQPEANDKALWPTCMGSREPPAEQESTSVTQIYRGILTSEQLWPLRV